MKGLSIAVTSGILLGGLWVGAPLTTAQPAQTPSAAPYEISGLKASLYRHSQGAFDTTDIMGTLSYELWNVRSGATLVSVQISSAPGAPRRNVDLNVVAKVQDRVLGEQTVPVYSFYGSSNRVMWIPVLIRGTGCGQTNVTATLLDSTGTRVSTMTKGIPFSCGE